MKSILLIGVGRFGLHMAKKFRALRQEVMAIDLDEQRINDVLPYVTNAKIGDCTNPKFIDTLGVRNFDVCVVAIGDDFQSSLETTSLLKEKGAKFVVARASREVHAKFLLRNGADEVIYPEKQSAEWAAVEYSSEHVFDYIELTPEYGIYETDIPRSWVGHTIKELSVRQKYGINILATKADNQLNPMPGPDYSFTGKETILILGEHRTVQKFVHM